MQTIPEFTIDDLVKEPDEEYANFEGGNRVFIIFMTVSSEMKKLKESDKFTYKNKTYQISARIPPDDNHPKSTHFNCLEITK